MITISESFSNDLVSRGLIEDTKEERFEMESFLKGYMMNSQNFFQEQKIFKISSYKGFCNFLLYT
jgi:tRNA splicing endonuclease